MTDIPVPYTLPASQPGYELAALVRELADLRARVADLEANNAPPKLRLSDLTDVALSGNLPDGSGALLIDGDVLVWNRAASLWVPGCRAACGPLRITSGYSATADPPTYTSGATAVGTKGTHVTICVFTDRISIPPSPVSWLAVHASLNHMTVFTGVVPDNSYGAGITFEFPTACHSATASILAPAGTFVQLCPAVEAAGQVYPAGPVIPGGTPLNGGVPIQGFSIGGVIGLPSNTALLHTFDGAVATPSGGVTPPGADHSIGIVSSAWLGLELSAYQTTTQLPGSVIPDGVASGQDLTSGQTPTFACGIQGIVLLPS